MFIEFRNEDEKLFLYKEEKLVSEIIEPTILWDSVTKRVIQIGDKEHVLNYYNISKNICKQKKETLYQNWLVIELTKEAEVINHLLQHPEEVILFVENRNIKSNIA